MTFENLPPNLRELALDDPVLRADAVDLFVTHADRESGCVVLLILDGEHRIATPVVIAEMGPPTAEQLALVVERVVAELRPPALVVALSRSGSPLFTDTDRECHQTVVDGCRDAAVDLLGTFVATPGAVRELPDHLRLAS